MWRMDSMFALVLCSSNGVEHTAAQRQGRLSLTNALYAKPYVRTLHSFIVSKKIICAKSPAQSEATFRVLEVIQDSN
jgi:hypothetical protein